MNTPSESVNKIKTIDEYKLKGVRGRGRPNEQTGGLNLRQERSTLSYNNKIFMG